LTRYLNFYALFTCTIIAAVSLVACTSQYRNHGYVPSEEELAELVVGVDTRDSIEARLGSATFSDILDKGAVYYMRSRVRHLGYQAPEVVERTLVAINFDEEGVLSNIETYDLTDGREILLTQRVTESSVSNQGFLRQLLGNIGRVNPGDFLE